MVCSLVASEFGDLPTPLNADMVKDSMAFTAGVSEEVFALDVGALDPPSTNTYIESATPYKPYLAPSVKKCNKLQHILDEAGNWGVMKASRWDDFLDWLADKCLLTNKMQSRQPEVSRSAILPIMPQPILQCPYRLLCPICVLSCAGGCDHIPRCPAGRGCGGAHTPGGNRLRSTLH
jgi:hypothetical protein